MEWNKDDIKVLEEAVFSRHAAFRGENKTDRKNLSELWNRHVRQIGVTGVRPPKNRKKSVGITVHDLVDIINFRNSEVSDALCVRNPDRPDQYLLIPRDIASKILMLGMP